MNSNQISQAEVGVPVASENLYSLRDGLVAGAVAGLAMTLTMAIWGAITGNGIWYPVNLIAATVLTDLQTAPTEQLQNFIPMAAVVGSIIHMVISLALGLIFNLLLPTLPSNPIIWALIIGPVLWIAAEYAILPVLNQRLAQEVAPQTFIISHIVYSLVLGLMIIRGRRLEPSSASISA
jgi:vacuolar-type H+-ATPase subunit I/STV1